MQVLPYLFLIVLVGFVAAEKSVWTEAPTTKSTEGGCHTNSFNLGPIKLGQKVSLGEKNCIEATCLENGVIEYQSSCPLTDSDPLCGYGKYDFTLKNAFPDCCPNLRCA